MLIPISITNQIERKDVEIKEYTFSELNLRESHIEEFIRKNIDSILEDETLLIVGQQVRDKENKRDDLVAIDENGNIVLLEIKRDKKDMLIRKEPLEIQSIRYAASFAKIKTVDEFVEKVFGPYVDQYKTEFNLEGLTPYEKAKRLLLDFLKTNESLKTFNSKQRIILVSSEFDNQTLSAVAWLVSNNIDISCFTLTPIKIEEDYLMKIERVLPLEKLDNLYVEISDRKEKSTSKSKGKRNNLPRMNKLFEWDILREGDVLYFKDKNKEDTKAIVINPNEVEYQGEKMSYTEWGKRISGWSSIQIYKFAISERLTKDLFTLREEKIEEENE